MLEINKRIIRHHSIPREEGVRQGWKFNFHFNFDWEESLLEVEERLGIL